MQDETYTSIHTKGLQGYQPSATSTKHSEPNLISMLTTVLALFSSYSQFKGTTRKSAIIFDSFDKTLPPQNSISSFSCVSCTSVKQSRRNLRPRRTSYSSLSSLLSSVNGKFGNINTALAKVAAFKGWQSFPMLSYSIG